MRKALKRRTQLLALHWTQAAAEQATRTWDGYLDHDEDARVAAGLPAWAQGVRSRRVGPLRNAMRGRKARVTFVVEATEWKGHR